MLGRERVTSLHVYDGHSISGFPPRPLVDCRRGAAALLPQTPGTAGHLFCVMVP